MGQPHFDHGQGYYVNSYCPLSVCLGYVYNIYTDVKWQHPDSEQGFCIPIPDRECELGDELHARLHNRGYWCKYVFETNVRSTQ